MNGPLVSVVIPAHNEESGIGRCLRLLTDTAANGELDVVVVANACQDATAEVARLCGARVLETPIAGKAHALRLGDAQCRTFPRLYLDADVDLSTNSVRAMVAALATTDALACAPTPVLDTTGASWVVIRFNRVLDRLLAGRRGLAGTGAYLLDAVGHGRVFPLPDLINDDGYVNRSFSSAEQVVVPAARAVVRPPKTVAAVVRRRARVRLGNRALDRLGLPAPEGRINLGDLRTLVRRREVGLLDAACFLSVMAIERGLALWRDVRGENANWSSDRTSRDGSPVSAAHSHNGYRPL